MRFRGVRSIAGGTALLTATQAVAIAARFVYVVLVARLLGPEPYALLVYSQSWYLAFLPLALFGLGPALILGVSREPARAAELAAEGLGLRLATTAMAAVACLLVAARVSPDPRAPMLILLLMPALVGRAVTAFAQHLYVASQANRHALHQELAFRGIELGLTAAVLLAGGGPLAVVAVQSLAWVAQAAVALRLVHREIVPVRIAWPPRRWQPLLLLALPFVASGLATDWRGNGPLILFRSAGDDPVAFGQFALAFQALLIAGTLPQSLIMAAQPVLARSVVRGDGKDLLFASAVQRLGILAGTAVALVGLAAGGPVFGFLFGPRFVPAGELAGLTLWCLVPLLAGSGYPSLVVARGHLHLQGAASVLGAVLMTVLLPPLAAARGAPGAIAAAGVGFAVPVLVQFAYARARGWADLRRALVMPLLAAAVALGTWLGLAPLGPALGLAAALAALVGAALVLGVVSPAERELARQFLRDAR